MGSHETLLKAITQNTKPADLIAELGDTLLDAFRPRPLIDEYGVYEQLMEYWNSVMHDDVALIMSMGWDDAAKPRQTIINKARGLAETPDLVIGSGRKATRWKTDLIPPALIVDRYFPEEKARVDRLDADAEAASQAVEEFIEENSGEDGPLADAMEDDRITKALATKRLKVAKIEDRHSDEVKALSQLIKLYGKETVAKSEAKEAHAELDQTVLDQYGKLTTADIQSLVIDDKWGRRMTAGVNAELSALIQKLVERLSVLAERYEETAGDLEAEVEHLRAKVAGHLTAMGIFA